MDGRMANSTSASSVQLRLSLEQVSTFLDDAFPPTARAKFGQIVSLDLNHVRMRLDPDPSMIRPGNIVSGPSLMGLVDVAAYAVIAAHNGPEAMAVTNALSITFLRSCDVKPVFADARLLKLGRRLASVDVRLWQDEETRLVAQSTVSYALP